MAGGAVWSPLFQDPSLPISLQTLKSKSTCHCEPGACVLRDKGGSAPSQPLIVPIFGLREGCATSEKWGNGSRRGEQVQKVEERAPSGWTIPAGVSTQKRCDFNVTTSFNCLARERLSDTWTQPKQTTASWIESMAKRSGYAAILEAYLPSSHSSSQKFGLGNYSSTVVHVHFSSRKHRETQDLGRIGRNWLRKEFSLPVACLGTSLCRSYW